MAGGRAKYQIPDTMLSTLVSYLHDFFAAMLFASCLLGIYFGRLYRREKSSRSLKQKSFGFLKKLIWVSFALACLLGVPRTFSFAASDPCVAHSCMVILKHHGLAVAVVVVMIWAFRSMRVDR